MVKAISKAVEDYPPIITDIHFVPMKRLGSFVGFVSFRYDREKWGLCIKSVAVHEKADKSAFRLVYPEDGRFKRTLVYPINRQTQQLIEAEVNAYLTANADSIWDPKRIKTKR